MRRPSSFQDDVEETPKAAKSSALGQSSSRPSKAAGPLDAWLHTATVDVHIARAAKVLSAVDEGVSDAITSQIQELSEVNAQLSLKLRVARHEATTLKRKLTCAETAIRNLRMHVADVLDNAHNLSDAHDVHKALLHEVVGKGYGMEESGKRLLRLHASDIVQAIQAKAGKDDTLRQMELAHAVQQRLSPVRTLTPNEESAINAAIVDSIREWIATLKTVFNGRFPNEIRAGYHAARVLQAAGHKCRFRKGLFTAAAVARVLGSDGIRAAPCLQAC
jgi:hypothetical protein